MSLRFSQRQLDALREEGVEAGRTAERKEQISRSMDRVFAREPIMPPQAPTLTTMGDVREGTILATTEDGVSFYKGHTVKRVIRPGEGLELAADECWVVTEGERGRTGQRAKISDRVMVLSGAATKS